MSDLTTPTIPPAAKPGARRAHRPTLARIARRIAAQPTVWQPLVAFDAEERFATRLPAEGDHEIWLLTWLPGQGTVWHDHAGSAGAFATVRGTLTETWAHPRDDGGGAIAGPPRRLPAGTVRPFGPRHIHRVVNDGPLPAVSVHVYAPSLTEMREYEVRGSLLVFSGSQLAGVNW